LACCGRVQKIIKEDIGNDSFGIQESLPPKYMLVAITILLLLIKKRPILTYLSLNYSCKLTQEAIDKLNLLPGVTVKVKEKGV